MFLPCTCSCTGRSSIRASRAPQSISCKSRSFNGVSQGLPRVCNDFCFYYVHWYLRNFLASAFFTGGYFCEMLSLGDFIHVSHSSLSLYGHVLLVLNEIWV